MVPGGFRFVLMLFAMGLAVLAPLVPLQVAQALTYTVTNLDDNGTGSLRQAILDANTNPGPDTITIDTSELPGTAPYTFQLTSGTLAITDSVDIIGVADPEHLIVQHASGDEFRIFTVSGTGNVVTISGMTISGGSDDSVSGGGILIQEENSLNLSNVVVKDSNRAGSWIHGGGIYNDGTLTLTNSLVSGNLAGHSANSTDGAGGGIYNTAGGKVTIVGGKISLNIAHSGTGVGRGGGIYSLGEVIISGGTEISDNDASTEFGLVPQGGGIFSGVDAILTITDAKLERNETKSLEEGEGGGIYTAGTATITGSTLSENSSDTGGGIFSHDGELNIVDSTLTKNTAYVGGGLAIDEDATATITGSTFSLNEASYGGGLFASGNVSVTDSDIAGNEALASPGRGGGVYVFSSGEATLLNSRIVDNDADTGGGGIHVEYSVILSQAGTLTLTDSTVAGNTTGSYGGGIFNDSGEVTITTSTISGNGAFYGGGIASVGNASVEIANSTISGNTTVDDDGGGIDFKDGELTIANSTIFNNESGTGSAINAPSGSVTLTGSIIASVITTTVCVIGNLDASSSYNMSNSGACLAADVTNVLHTLAELNMGALADNGGPTFTHHPQPGSVVLNKIPAADCQVMADQRGVSRPQGTGCEIGSVEVGTPVFTQGPGNTTATSTSPDGTTVNYTLPVAVNATGTGLPVTCLPIPGSLFPLGTSTITCEATDAFGQTTIQTWPITVQPANSLRPTIQAGINTRLYTNNPAGLAVRFAPVASSPIDPNPVVTCNPPSGSVFPIGTTQVTCYATDMYGLTSTPGNFLIIVVLGDPPATTPPSPPSPPAPPVDPGDEDDGDPATPPPGEEEHEEEEDRNEVDTSAFDDLWTRNDSPVANGTTVRSWTWGPGQLTSLAQTDNDLWEEYGDGERVVRYYDKSRMEISDPDGDTSSIWYVTNGLLATELIMGMLQVGDVEFIEMSPANVPVAGDFDDPDGPTYATFTDLTGAVENRVGETITSRLSRDGTSTDDQGLAARGVAYAYYDEVTGHNVAAPFHAFMHSTGMITVDGELVEGPLFPDPLYAVGRPITEAFWATVLVGGTPHDVLMQCFERRCLTYTPENPEEWQIEAGNVGLHYFWWRYGQ